MHFVHQKPCLCLHFCVMLHSIQYRNGRVQHFLLKHCGCNGKVLQHNYVAHSLVCYILLDILLSPLLAAYGKPCSFPILYCILCCRGTISTHHKPHTMEALLPPPRKPSPPRPLPPPMALLWWPPDSPLGHPLGPYSCHAMRSCTLSQWCGRWMQAESQHSRQMSYWL